MLPGVLKKMTGSLSGSYVLQSTSVTGDSDYAFGLSVSEKRKGLSTRTHTQRLDELPKA